MKLSIYAAFALTVVPAVSSLKYLRRMLDEEEEEDTRVSFAVGRENADKSCLHELIDTGFTDDQIRWIYSNYDEAQLIESGWDPSSLANSDGDDSTHLWSELHPDCPAEEILISAIADTYDIHDLTFGRFLKEKETGTEDHRDEIFLCDEQDDCADYVVENPTAITFFSRSLYESGRNKDTHDVALKDDQMTFVVGLLETDPCIQKLANDGMSHDTLRWIYSFYTEEQLLASGWDSKSVPNSDGDDSTHLWSEIDPDCPAEEIALSALTDENYLHDYVFGEIFAEKEDGEDHRDSVYLCPQEDDCAEFVEENEYGITFFTKHRQEEAHSEDTLQVNSPFLPSYLDFATEGDNRGDPEPDEEEDTRVSFAVGRENADKSCLHDLIDTGFTDDQIRWIYSNYDEAQLIESGWDPSALANSDGDDSTHLWSELHPDCPAEEILISAIADTFDIHDLTFGRFLKEKETGTEDHRDEIFLCDEPNDCADFVVENPTAITFFSTSLYESGRNKDTHDVALKDDQMAFIVGTEKNDLMFLCIAQLLDKGGFSNDALRWMYSFYTEEQLLASGWDAKSVPNSDGDDSTHLWSELDANCPTEEIALSALTDENYLHDYVFDEIFAEKEDGEDHRESVFLCPQEDDCAEFAEDNEFGITFFTKHRQEEAHSDDTIQVNNNFTPFYLDFATEGDNRGDPEPEE